MTKKELIDYLSNPEIPDNAEIVYVTWQQGSVYQEPYDNEISSINYIPFSRTKKGYTGKVELQ